MCVRKYEIFVTVNLVLENFVTFALYLQKIAKLRSLRAFKILRRPKLLLEAVTLLGIFDETQSKLK